MERDRLAPLSRLLLKAVFGFASTDVYMHRIYFAIIVACKGGRSDPNRISLDSLHHINIIINCNYIVITQNKVKNERFKTVLLKFRLNSDFFSKRAPKID